MSKRSTDPRLPLWLRLTALAVETAETDTLGGQSAVFGPGEVRTRLAAGLDLDPSAVSHAIRQAERRGLLAPGSSTRCLRVMPGSLTTGEE